MNISFTWANYALITGLCLVGYYLIIGWIYYRKDLVRLLYRKGTHHPPVTTLSNSSVVSTNQVEQAPLRDDPALAAALSSDDSIPQEDNHLSVQDLVEEVEAYTQACSISISKEELAAGLRIILQKYPSLMNSSLQPVLLDIIITAARHHCSIQWHEDEWKEWWNG